MLVVLALWLVQFIALKAWGNLTINLFTPFKGGWFEELIAGYCCLSFIAVFLSLFIPLNFWVHCSLTIVSLALLLFNKKIKFTNFKWNKSYLLPCLIAIMILLLSVPVPNHGDSSFYHAQALQWIEKYPAIPGLGNLFGRLAFNSSLFNVQALFSLYPVSDISSHYLNSFIILIWFIFLLQSVANKSNTSPVRLLSLLFAVASLLIMRGWVSSVAPDVMAGLFMLIITYKFLLVILEKQDIPLLYFLTIAFTAITIKITTLFALPLLLFYPGLLKKINKSSILIPFMIILPWIARTIILSGYLVYPYCPTFVWTPDWQISNHDAFIERAWITSWARIPELRWQQVLPLSFAQWFPVWLKNQYLINKIILLLLGFGSLISFVRTVSELIKKRMVSKLNLLALAWCSLGILWLIAAPDFRFGYGVLLPCLIFIFTSVFNNKIKLRELHFKAGLWGFSGLLCLLMVYVIKKEHTPLLHCILLPQPYPKVQLLQGEIDGIRINIAPDDNCWNTAVPCVELDIFPYNIEARGKVITEGFKPKDP